MKKVRDDEFDEDLMKVFSSFLPTVIKKKLSTEMKAVVNKRLEGRKQWLACVK